MLSKLIFWVLLAAVCSTVIKILLQLDLNKAVYNHVPGPCRHVEGIEHGSEDIELLPDGSALITSGLKFWNKQSKIRGRIFRFDFNSNSSIYEAQPMKIIGDSFDEKSFVPHGLTSFTTKGRTLVYVVNHGPGGDTIECFSYSKKALTHTKTIRDPLIHAPNDLVAVAVDRLFIANDHYFNNGFLQMAEVYLQLNLGSLVYFDGRTTRVTASWLLSPNSVGVDKQQHFLYLSLPSAEVIRIYRLNKDMSVEKHADMSLLTSVDNIFVEPDTGELWVGAHPVAYRVLRHLRSPKTERAPSQVLRLRVQEGHNSWVVTEPYADDGQVLSASSAAVFHKGQLLVGTVHDRLLHCDVLNPDLA